MSEGAARAQRRAQDVRRDRGVTQPAPAPRFRRTAPAVPAPPAKTGGDGESVLASFGFGADEIRALRESKAVA